MEVASTDESHMSLISLKMIVQRTYVFTGPADHLCRWTNLVARKAFSRAAAAGVERALRSGNASRRRGRHTCIPCMAKMFCTNATRAHCSSTRDRPCRPRLATKLGVVDLYPAKGWIGCSRVNINAMNLCLISRAIAYDPSIAARGAWR